MIIKLFVLYHNFIQLTFINFSYIAYPDPIQFAPPSFQHRILELSAFESDTIKWERLRKKKSK